MLWFFKILWDAHKLLFDWISTGASHIWHWLVDFYHVTTFWSSWITLFDGLCDRIGQYITEYLGGIFGDTTNSIFQFAYYFLAVDYGLYFIRILISVCIAVLGFTMQLLLYGVLIAVGWLVFAFVLRVVRLVSGGTLHP